MRPGVAGAQRARLAAGALVVALALQVGAFIVSHSNTFDEAAVIGAGFSYVRTGRLELETTVHPPLLKYLFGAFVSLASPAFHPESEGFRRLQPYLFGHEFLFRNTATPETLLALARLPSLLLSLALAACLWRWGAWWFGPWGGTLAVAAYAFEPNILAHSGLANMDLGLTAFLFMACYFLVRHLEEPSPRRLLCSGLLAGCAVASKLPGLFFFAWSACLAWYGTRRLEKAARINALLLGAASVVVIACYQVRYLPLLGGLAAQMFPAMFTNHPTERHWNFLHGELQVGGWRRYYLVALAVKTTLPFIALVALGAWKGLSRKERVVLAIPTVLWFAACTAASKQNGLRYVLPMFPFFCLAIGSLARLSAPRLRAAAALLLLWSAGETLLIAPNYLAYFNELAGGPGSGYRWLVDSNLDWGQDFPRIRDFLRREGKPETIVATLGNGDRDHYFGPHQDLLAWADDPAFNFRHVNSSAPARELLIVSASFLQGYGLSDPQAFAWLRDRPPLAQPGYSTFVYDVTTDGLSHFNLGRLYVQSGKRSFARREFGRAAALSPDRPQPFLALGDVLELEGDSRSAVSAYGEALRRAGAPEAAGLRRVIEQRLSSARRAK